MDDDEERDEMLKSQFGSGDDYKRISKRLYDYFHKSEVFLDFIVTRLKFNHLIKLLPKKNICLNI